MIRIHEPLLTLKYDGAHGSGLLPLFNMASRSYARHCLDHVDLYRSATDWRVARLTLNQTVAMDTLTAQSRVNQLLTCKAETITLLRDIGLLLEECVPHSSAWIVKNSNEDGAARLIFSSSKATKARSSKTIDSVSAEPLSELMRKIGRQQEIADIKGHPLATEIKETLKAPRARSLITIPIRPSNSDSWGHLCVLLTSHRGRDTSLKDALLWAQFAVTIAERRLLEERVQTIETRLDLATKAGGIGIFDWDVSTNSIFWTPQQFEIYGLSPDTFRPSYATWSKTVVPEDLHVIESLLKDTFKDKSRYFENSYRFQHASGETRWIKTLAEVIYDDHGMPVRSIGTEQDITEQIRAQEQIISDRRRLELALEAGELGFWDWNIATNDVQFGGEWAHMLGYEINEIEPHFRSWERLAHPDDVPVVLATLREHLEGRSPLYETEHRLRHKNGSWVWVLDRGRVIERDYSGKPIRAIGIHANITQQRETREKLREADRRKDEFLATLAHELRNPLAPIRTGLAIIKRDPSGALASQALGIMERQLAHMVRLIDDLLDVSRITRGQLQLKREDISLQVIVEMAVESSKPAIDFGHHILSINLPQGEIILNCDPTRLAQTISNLLTNSAKYTPDGGQISLTAQMKESSVDIQVSDNGMGIPAEYLEKIFDLFGQVNLSLHRAQGGLGIGLALVRNLVALHGGTVKASSGGLEKGSTFTISLPLSLVRTPITETLPERLAEQSMSHHRILIVDDNVDAANSLAMLARLLGHTTEVAFSGAEALKKLTEFEAEVIFLDIGLPDMSGFEVATHIRALHLTPSPFVIALTGWGSEETKQKAREAGFDGHLTKPVEISKVEDILRKRGKTPPCCESGS